MLVPWGRSERGERRGRRGIHAKVRTASSSLLPLLLHRFSLTNVFFLSNIGIRNKRGKHVAVARTHRWAFFFLSSLASRFPPYKCFHGPQNTFHYNVFFIN
ncbi:hypothetical protein JHK84_026869 [Glycine max]|nr:hypothetical protein JHK85_027254 [Glycine max]KAG5150397.1 hypothetical protein JHK84_026869 [Glycine max]